MIDRLLALLDRPLDPRAGRAIVVLAVAVSFGFAAVVVIAGTVEQSSRSASVADRGQTRASSVARTQSETASREALLSRALPDRRRQDPQDDSRSAAGRRAERALRSHRALQHVPYRGWGITVVLKGARHGRAVLVVSAPTAASARAGWRKFLRRFDDTGRAYVPIFKDSGDQGRRSFPEAYQRATPGADQQATRLAAHEAGSIDEGKPAFAHRTRDCDGSVSQRSPRHIEGCS